MSTEPSPLEADYTPLEVASAMRKSEKWLRNRIRAGVRGEGPAVEHTRRGNKITFTRAQVELLRAADAVVPVADFPITTGRKKA